MDTQTRPNDRGILVYDLFISKGETAAFEVGMEESSYNDNVEVLSPVPFVNGDIIVFTVKDSKGTEIVKKTITSFTEDGTAIISLLSSDTINVKALTYKYDVLGTTAAYGNIPIMYKANFTVDETVGEY